MPPTAQPTEIKRRRGNPGKRPLNMREPKPMVGLPMCPDTLTGNARRIWEEKGPGLVRAGVMTELDGPAFADWCMSEALIDRYRQLGDEIGIDDIRTALNLLKERRAQHAQFGMTPSSRSKIVAGVPEDVDPLESALVS
jgi:hypothetical protein